MNKKKREDIFGILIILSLLFMISPFLRYMGPADISGSWRFFVDDENMPRIESEFNFTGRDATLMTIGILFLLAAFLFKYKKFPDIRLKF